MNWNDPHIRLSLKELQETLDWRGRDSRIVRAAFAWSRCKKRWMRRVKQFFARPPEGDASAPRVLFWLAGGMGDAAGARRLVTAYRAFLPNARFDVYSPLPGVARMLFGADKNTRILEKDNMRFSGYDLAVQTCLSAKFLHVRKDRLSRLAPAFLPVLERAQAAQDSLGVLLEDPFLTEGVLGRWLYAQGGRRFDLLAYTGGTELPHDAQERLPADGGVLKKFGLEGAAYITFHDGTSHAQKVGRTRPTRAWPAVRWCEFVRLFKREFPQIKVVQLGGHNSPVYEEADICLVGKTDVTELPSLLAGALAHADTESGLVQLVQYTDVRSAVAFGPSSARFLGFAKNENLAAGPCGGCMWTTADWMMNCPLGHTPAPCTERVSAREMLEAVKRILRR